jgi:uncharacterized protein (DUF433 family)
MRGNRNAAMPTVTDIGSLIVRSEDIHGNRPCVAGTGVTFRRIVGWYKQGLTPEEITTEVSHLSLTQVYAALTYYHANREQIEADISRAWSRRAGARGSCLACAVHLVWKNDLIAWPLQPCCEKLDDSGDIALIKVAQGSVFCHLNDPKPGIRQYCAEQFPAFCYAQSIGVGEIHCRHILFVQNIDIAVQ